MKRHYHTYLLSLGLLFITALPVQANEPPLALLKTTTSTLITALTNNKTALRKDPLVVNRLVERILIPHIDFISASKWVLGKHWRRANKKQKIRFIKAFRNLLIRFYSTALADYLKTNDINKDMMRFLPIRGGAKDDVTVRSELHSPNGKKISVNYYLHQTRKGWKVYDVSVEGISMITTYRTSFATQIKQQGIDNLINSLVKKNSSTATN